MRYTKKCFGHQTSVLFKLELAGTKIRFTTGSYWFWSQFNDRLVLNTLLSPLRSFLFVTD
jgi:hypothetical protein